MPKQSIRACRPTWPQSPAMGVAGISLKARAQCRHSQFHRSMEMETEAATEADTEQARPAMVAKLAVENQSVNNR